MAQPPIMGFDGNDHDPVFTQPPADDLFDWGVQKGDAEGRPLIDQLIKATQLYDTANARKDLLDFVIRFRSMAPFNAMLLQAQRPGLTHVATAEDWRKRFNRWPTEAARPLVILRTMGPVDFVFDVNETQGDPLPDAAFTFPTYGDLDQNRWLKMLRHLPRCIAVAFTSDGDARAGSIYRPSDPKPTYEVCLNRNHPEVTQFVTLAHELAHLYLGHLGEDRRLHVSDRSDVSLIRRELEAEVAAYVVAKRNGVTPLSEKYLHHYLEARAHLDESVVLRAANAVETALGISATQLWKLLPTRRQPNNYPLKKSNARASP